MAFKIAYQTITSEVTDPTPTAKPFNMSLRDVAKKFNTELTDYSTSHIDKNGPYAENLNVDTLVVGAGFGKLHWRIQGRWIADAIDKIETGGIKYIDPKLEAADAWKQHIVELNDKSLFPTTRSTYMGGSIPGKVYEPVCYSGGIPAYAIEIREALDHMEGFDVVKG